MRTRSLLAPKGGMSASARLGQVLVLLCAALLAACGASGSGTMSSASLGVGASTSSCTNCGAAVVSLTDAPGDFVTYLVNVVSIQLKRADGTVVETVPVSTQVDFAQMVNLAEIISAKQVPAGQYVSAMITLDYSGATIAVEGATGTVTIAPDQIINGNTNVALVAPNPTQMTLTLALTGTGALAVTPGAVANLALDFNLLASNSIAPSSGAPTTVSVNPTLTASLAPDITKNLRARGPLVSVDTSAGSYVITMRPFQDVDDTAGSLTVNTTATTTWNINGSAYTGSDGLAQLAKLPAGTMTAALGQWSTTTRGFTASTVLVGSSVAGFGGNGIEGTVIARTLDQFTLANGIEWHQAQSTLKYVGQMVVTVAPATAVSEDGASGPFSIADISVGQHLQVSGTLGSDGSGNPTLDASAGTVRLMATRVQGTVTGTMPGQVILNLISLDGRAPGVFNFAGTGGTQDATATAYSINVPSALSPSGLTSGVPAQFTGFVTPFGTAPPDFAAQSLVNFALAPATLQVRWGASGSTAPFATVSSTELLISQATLQTSSLSGIRLGPSRIDARMLASGLQLVPDAADANPQLAIGHWQSQTVDTYSTFAAFAAAIGTDLNDTVAALQLVASGPYNAGTGALSVDQAVLVLND